MHANDMINLANSSLSSSSSSSILINIETSNTSSKSTSTTPVSTNLTASLSKTNTKNKLTVMEAFLESIGDDIESQDNGGTRASIIEELHTYRSLLNKYNSKNKPNTFTCFSFWKTYEFTLPYLFTLAKRYVCTPATSVPSE
jgi:hypothetical protein